MKSDGEEKKETIIFERCLFCLIMNHRVEIFQRDKDYLKKELLEIENGNAIFVEEKVACERLEKVIQKYEEPYADKT